MATFLRHQHHELPGDLMAFIYVASSWRCERQPSVVETLRGDGHDVYDFRAPPGGSGFSWKDVEPGDLSVPASNGSPLVDVETYLAMVNHPVAVAGYDVDLAAMKEADTCVLVLPCGRSAHLELGWFVGKGKRTAILLETEMEPELMYRLVDVMTHDLDVIRRWLG